MSPDEELDLISMSREMVDLGVTFDALIISPACSGSCA